MESRNTEYAYYTSKYFWWMLIGVWAFMTIVLGFFSDWMFSLLMPENPGNPLEAMTYSGTYALVLIAMFGLAWIPLNRYFSLQKKRNVPVHILVQISILIIGFLIGNLLTDKLHQMISAQEDFINEDARIAFALIAMMCLIGTLFVNGLF